MNNVGMRTINIWFNLFSEGGLKNGSLAVYVVYSGVSFGHYVCKSNVHRNGMGLELA